MGFALGSGVSDWIGSKLTSDDEEKAPITKEEKIKQKVPGYTSVETSQNTPLTSTVGDYNDNSSITIQVHSTGDPEETANIVMKKLSSEKRKQQRSQHRGGQLYDTTGVLPG